VSETDAPLPNRDSSTTLAASTLDVTAILPAFNEEGAILDDLNDVRSALQQSGRSFEIIVVDDGSTDRTSRIVDGLDWVRVIRHPFNRGNGAARTTGLLAARGRIVVFTDADRTYPNDRIVDLLHEVDSGADMVIGAREREAGTMRMLRTPAKAFMRRLAEFMTGSKIPDLNSGLRAQRRDVTLSYLSMLPTSHSWVSTITIAFLSGGYLVRWVPIDYFPRVGRSTFHPLRDSYNYVTLIVRTVMYFNPLKIFLPLSLMLITLAALKYGLYDLFWRFGPGWPGFVPPMPSTTLAMLVVGAQLAVVGLLADLIVRRTRL
jgi:glycosyltransferase involved in cell wall biosynthesis